MKTDRLEAITHLIFNAIDQVNELLPSERCLEKTPETILSNKSEQSSLDSLGMVNFIVALEQLISEEMGVSVSLADDLIISEEQNPFQTVSILADNIDKLLMSNQVGL